MEAKSLRSKCERGWFLLRAERERLFHSSLVSGGLLGNLWCSLAYSPVCLSGLQSSPFYKDASHCELWTNSNASFGLDFFFKDPSSKEGHVLKYWDQDFNV